jgi:hypothetical protein
LVEFKLNNYYIQLWGCTAVDFVKKFSILGSVVIASLAIAQSASARFVIFVAGNDFATLQRVRTVSPAAFATKINNQPAIQAGTFNSETSADSLAIALQQSGLSAQKYFRSSGGKENDVPVPFPETSSVTSLPNPQQVVIQQNPIPAIPQPVSFQAELQPQVITTMPQPAQYQQITTNAVIPQVQSQQVLVPRWQQVLVPETRQVVTQVAVPQTQIVQTGFIQPQTGFIQPQTGFVQPQTGFIQPQTGFIQPQTGFIQPQTGFIQPQTGFIPASNTTVASTYDSNSFVVQPQQVQPQVFQTQQVQPQNVQYQAVQSVPVTTSQTDDSLLPQNSQNPNFRYVAAVPAKSNNQFLLSRVRQIVPNAFFANSGRGAYIHAGAYQSRDAAESVSRYLRSQGVDSRVLYF